MNKYFFILFGVAIMSTLSAQTKIKDGTVLGSPSTPSPDAILELESINKGLLMPRISLSSTTNFVPLASHIAGMIVYNTNTAGSGITAVTPGFYYNDGTQWVKIGAASGEPWYDQATGMPAALNTQNIYQMGTVAVGKTNSYAGAALDVNGALRAGTNPLGAVGANSFAMGQNNAATAANASAFGLRNTASGTHSSAFGSDNTTAGSRSMAFGTMNAVNGAYSSAIGGLNVINGYYTTTIGGNNVTSANYEFIVGTNNAVTTGNSTLFQIGNGDPNTPTVRSNTLTMLKNGYTAIGVFGTETAAFPTERLDIGQGNIRIRDINTNTGSGTNRLVVADTFGVLKTVPSSSLSVEPWNVSGTVTKATLNTQDIYQIGNIGINQVSPEAKLHVVANVDDLTPAIMAGCLEFADNAEALAAGLSVGSLYRTGDALKIVH